MTSRIAGAAAGVLSALAVASPAVAAPVTVDLRIEGPTRTLYEGSVTTDTRPFRFTEGDDTAEHACGSSPTRGAAITQASLSVPFSTRGTFFEEFQSPSFDAIAGESVAYDDTSKRYLVEYKNGRFAEVGACGDPIAEGDDVLFAYGTGNDPLLALAGPATARPGEEAELTVTDARDGSPVAGALVRDRTSDAAGKVRVPVTERGPNELKATKEGAIRSNRATVCVTDGQDGFCGTAAPAASPTPAPTPAPRDIFLPIGRFTDDLDDRVFARGRGPRSIRVQATDASGIDQVRLRIVRRRNGACTYFSGRLERFRRTDCGRGFYFRASRDAAFSYLLPERLGPGRYRLDVAAIDRAGNRDILARGRSRVRFTVR